MLSRDDLRDFLLALSAAIELDQLRVDRIPALKFNPQYHNEMWRGWRADHLNLVAKLLLSIERVTQTTLEELTTVAQSRDPTKVCRLVTEMLAEIGFSSFL